LFVLLLAVSAFAIESGDTKGILRTSNFPLDNVHILRLQEASMSLSKNVSSMHQELQDFQVEQSKVLSGLRSGMEQLQRSVGDKISGMQTVVESIPAPQVQAPVEIKLPSYLMVLLGVNIFLLILVIVLIFWLREQYFTHKVIHKEEHIHPAPPELIAFVGGQLEHDKKLSDIRMELANRGWTPSIIEHAIHAAKEK